MKRKFLIALSMLVCMSTFTLGLTACGSDDEPNNKTMTQQFTVQGKFIYQDGTFVGGYPGAADPNGKEFLFYNAIYEEVKEIIKAQVWDVSFKPDEKDQKIKEQNAVAEQRFTTMVKALEAVQKKLDQADKNTYKCHFGMKIELKAVGEKEIRSGQVTLSYAGNED